MLRLCTNFLKLNNFQLFHFSANIKEQRLPVLRETEVILPFTLNNLWDNEGARHKTKRLGRGNGSGKGNSCGRGQRGQKARPSAGVRPQLEGGQTPIQRRLPKWGARPAQELLQTINLNQILYAIWQGRIDPQETITIKTLLEAGLFRRVKYGVKVLARGKDDLIKLEHPLKIEVSDASQQAIQAIKDKGGQVTCIYRTPLLLREHLKPEKYGLQLRDPIPPSYKIEQLDRIESRGAEVVYRKPKWREEQLAKASTTQEEIKQQEPLSEQPAKLQKEKKKKKLEKETNEQSEIMEQQLKDFVYPAKREEGCGDTKIRLRKREMYRKIDYKF